MNLTRPGLGSVSARKAPSLVSHNRTTPSSEWVNAVAPSGLNPASDHLLVRAAEQGDLPAREWIPKASCLVDTERQESIPVQAEEGASDTAATVSDWRQQWGVVLADGEHCCRLKFSEMLVPISNIRDQEIVKRLTSFWIDCYDSLGNLLGF